MEKKAQNILNVIKYLPFQNLASYCYIIREQTELLAAIAEIIGLKGETDYHEIALGIVEYGKKVKAEEEKKKMKDLQEVA